MGNKAKRPRLKKGPEIADYVVELIHNGGVNKTYHHFMTREEARNFANNQITADRARIFRAKFTLVSDKKN